MSDGSDEEIVTFRLGPSDRAAIQRLVDKGDYRNRSDLLRHAVKTLLRDAGEPASRAKELDLNLEQVHLPTSAGPTARARGRARTTRSQSR